MIQVNKKYVIPFIIFFSVMLLLVVSLFSILINQNNTYSTITNNLTGETYELDINSTSEVIEQLETHKYFEDYYNLTDWFYVTLTTYENDNALEFFDLYREDNIFVIKNPILIIDAGHGGNDPGGGGNDLWLEKEMTLDISMYQYNRFIELGVPVKLTRDTDEFLSIEDRIKIANDYNASYMISNHINSGGGDGAEIIYSIHYDDTLANNILNKIESAGQNIRSAYTKTSEWSSKRDYYGLHKHSKNTEVLIIEYGFADSPKNDVELLYENWELYAECVVQAFCEHTGFEYSPPNN